MALSTQRKRRIGKTIHCLIAGLSLTATLLFLRGDVNYEYKRPTAGSTNSSSTNSNKKLPLKVNMRRASNEKPKEPLVMFDWAHEKNKEVRSRRECLLCYYTLALLTPYMKAAEKRSLIEGCMRDWEKVAGGMPASRPTKARIPEFEQKWKWQMGLGKDPAFDYVIHLCEMCTAWIEQTIYAKPLLRLTNRNKTMENCTVLGRTAMTIGAFRVFSDDGNDNPDAPSQPNSYRPQSMVSPKKIQSGFVNPNVYYNCPVTPYKSAYIFRIHYFGCNVRNELCICAFCIASCVLVCFLNTVFGCTALCTTVHAGGNRMQISRQKQSRNAKWMTAFILIGFVFSLIGSSVGMLWGIFYHVWSWVIAGFLMVSVTALWFYDGACVGYDLPGAMPGHIRKYAPTTPNPHQKEPTQSFSRSGKGHKNEGTALHEITGPSTVPTAIPPTKSIGKTGGDESEKGKKAVADSGDHHEEEKGTNDSSGDHHVDDKESADSGKASGGGKDQAGHVIQSSTNDDGEIGGQKSESK